MQIVEKLMAYKEKIGITNAEISKLSTIPLATITRIFNGSTPNPTFETISQIAIAMGLSIDELVGLKQSEEIPISSPIEKTLDSYVELLKEKDERIRDLKEEVKEARREKHRFSIALAIFVVFVLTIFTVDILNGHFGYFRY